MLVRCKCVQLLLCTRRSPGNMCFSAWTNGNSVVVGSALARAMSTLGIAIPLIAMPMAALALLSEMLAPLEPARRSAGATRWHKQRCGAIGTAVFFPPPKASSVAESQAGLPNGISRAALLPHPVHLETKL